MTVRWLKIIDITIKVLSIITIMTVIYLVIFEPEHFETSIILALLNIIFVIVSYLIQKKIKRKVNLK